MAWKIKHIHIENFKLFLKPFDLTPEGKNVLMYGENGSGKSSIYWAIYTHFQSALKQPTAEDAGKYFVADHPDNLRNLYDREGARSGIDITFVDSEDRTKGYTDASWSINTSGADDFMKKTVFASDFMNYKFLSAIFDFKNSKPVDLFRIFEEEVFPFLSIGKPCYDLTGQAMGNSGADYWWKYIQECYNTAGRLNKRSPESSVYTHDEVWNTYQNLISDFNNGLQVQLTEIADAANQKLQEFRMPVKVSLTLEKAAFDKKIPETVRSYDGRFYLPKIILTAQLLDATGNPVSEKQIEHPRSFFNEAKLTRMALALRLAVFDRKLQDEDCAQVILVDDLLISLDMSNRLLVVQKLLDYVDRYQLFIFTHDRAFYDLICDSIDQRNRSKDWKYYEMYAIDEEVSISHVPEPWNVEPKIAEKLNHIQQARAFFSHYEYFASANSLRKECEKHLQRLYPTKWTLAMKEDGTTSLINLNGLIQKLKEFYKRFGFDPVPTPNIDQYRKRILNPASHNDDKAKIFRSELVIAIDEISKFERIKKVVISSLEDIGTRRFVMTIDKDAHHIVFEFEPMEEWSKLEYEGKAYFEGINVKPIHIEGMGLKVNKEHTVLSVFNRACKYAGFDEGLYPDMGDTIIEKSTGIKLKDIAPEL